MKSWLRGTALVVGIGLAVCLVTSAVVGFGTSVDLMGVMVRIEVVGLIAPGALAVLLAALTDPVPLNPARTWWLSSPQYPMSSNDATGRAIVRQNVALYAGGVVLIAVGVAVALLT